MKKIILVFCTLLLAVSSFSQTVVTESNGRVTIRNSNDSILVQIEPSGSGALSASFDNSKSEIAVVYNTGEVIIKNTNGGVIAKIAEPSEDNAISAVWSDKNIIITTQTNKTITKDSSEWR